MSRKCPKRHHLFLNWLRSNHSRFTFQPRIVVHGKYGFDFCFQGITTIIRCYYRSHLDYTCISIEIVWRGIEWDTLGCFNLGEQRINEGWRCRLDLPLEQRSWRTREIFYNEHCFEPFLEWCNNQLTTARWLELIEIGPVTSAYLHKDKPTTNASMLSKYEKSFTPLKGNGVVLPIRKYTDEGAIASSVKPGSRCLRSQTETITHHYIPPCM